MALIKKLETQYGNQVTYWKIIKINQKLMPIITWATLGGFIDKKARDSGKNILEERSFCFSEQDHPLAELDPNLINPDSLEDYSDFNQHLIYLHIKEIASFVEEKLPITDETVLSGNEMVALDFIKAKDG